MFIDYTDAFETVVKVAQSMLAHAGDVEVAEDDSGRLVLRLPVGVVYSRKLRQEIAVEIDQFERKDWPTPEDTPEIKRIVPVPK